jgi:hypothetical protein
VVVNELPLDKAPGPDGFTGRFYRSAWSIIKRDVIRAFDALSSMDFCSFHHLNDTLLILLPKSPNLLSLGDYRLISHIHSFRKKISKTLANRFALVLPLPVSPNQSAFIKGRQIQDNFRCVLGTTKVLAAKRNSQVILKIDLAKAFDSVEWVFLLDLLSAIGCLRNWTNWISTILSTANTKVLNGSLGCRICHCRGLRQGIHCLLCFSCWSWSAST